MEKSKKWGDYINEELKKNPLKTIAVVGTLGVLIFINFSISDSEIFSFKKPYDFDISINNLSAPEPIHSPNNYNYNIVFKNTGKNELENLHILEIFVINPLTEIVEEERWVKNCGTDNKDFCCFVKKLRSEENIICNFIFSEQLRGKERKNIVYYIIIHACSQNICKSFKLPLKF